jgi:hypothetical protein
MIGMANKDSLYTTLFLAPPGLIPKIPQTVTRNYKVIDETENVFSKLDDALLVISFPQNTMSAPYYLSTH